MAPSATIEILQQTLALKGGVKSEADTVKPEIEEEKTPLEVCEPGFLWKPGHVEDFDTSVPILTFPSFFVH